MIPTAVWSTQRKPDVLMSPKRPLYALKATVWCVFSVRPVDVKVRAFAGVDLDDAELTKLAAELKKKCGCGGAVKDGVIEIQGDKRDLLKSLLEAKGMKVKLAGG